MSKSKGNQFTVKELVDEGYSPMAMRYLLLSVYYRQQLNFTREGIRQAETAIRRVDDLLDRLSEVRREGEASEATRETASRVLRDFEAAMDADLNTSAALAALFDLVKEGNTALSSSSITKGDARVFRETIERMNQVFGVFGRSEKLLLDEEVEKLLQERSQARARRDFQRADSIRKELEGRGILLEDSPTGTRWRRK
jgi:cysteinyl-tRNA synthetase